MRTSPAPRPLLPRAAALAGAVALLTAGCSQGKEEFSGNRPDPSPAKAQVVRTPSPLGTDLPYTDPPLVDELPGPTGGAPGGGEATAPEASPGERADEGANAPSN